MDGRDLRQDFADPAKIMSFLFGLFMVDYFSSVQKDGTFGPVNVPIA